MNPSLDSKQIWKFRALLLLPLFISSIYHIARLAQLVGPQALFLIVVPLILSVVTFRIVESKFEYRIPKASDLAFYGIAFVCIATVNFSTEYFVNTKDRLHEAVSSVLSLLGWLPFAMIIGIKKPKPEESPSQ